MSAAKLKNIVILALLLLNIFLLALIIPNQLANLRSKQQANEALSQLYRQADVSLPAEIIPDHRQLYPTDLTPDHNAVLDAVRVLLGQQVLSQKTENGTHFSSAMGYADLTANDVFVAHVTLEKTPDPEAHARRILDEMGIACTNFRQEPSDGSALIYAATPTVDGVPVVTHTLRLRYEDGALTQVSGLLLTAGEATVTAASGCLSPQDALVAFLGSRMSTGWMGSAITAVTQSYHLSADATQDVFHLQPVYCITTDTGSYLVDGLTKTVSSL